MKALGRTRVGTLQSRFARLATMIACLSTGVLAAGMAGYFVAINDVIDRSVTPEERAIMDAAFNNPNVSSEQINALVDRYVYTPPAWQPFAVLALLAMIALAGALWLSRRTGLRFARPLIAVADTTRELAEGKLDARVSPDVPRGTATEVDQLIADVDTLGARLQAAEERMREDTAALAHELRTPLAALKGRIQAMVDGVFPVNEGEVSRLIAPIDRLTRLVEDLRMLSIARANRMELRRETVDLAVLVADLVEEVHPLAVSRAVTVETALEPALADIDDLRVRQVVMNLIDNALRYAGQGARLEIASRQLADGSAELTLRDNGPGWPDVELETLLNPFMRGDPSRARASGGSGLGLAIVHAIAEAHGGALRLSRNLAGGAEVTLILPGPASA